MFLSRWTQVTILFFLQHTESAIFNRYQPLHGTSIASDGVQVEVLASFSATHEIQQTAAMLVRKFFHPLWFITGDDSEKIGDMMERRFGGIFFVGMFSGESETAYTIVRRSPLYILFRVEDRIVLIAKESRNPKLHTDSLL